MPSLSVSPSTVKQGEIFTFSWSGFYDGAPIYLRTVSGPTDISGTLGNTSSGSTWGYTPTSWLGTYVLVAEQPPYGGYSNTVTFTVTAVAPPPPPPPEPYGKIIAIRVQDIAKQLWFNWDNGVWDRTPEVTVGANLYIAAYALNQGDAGIIQIIIKDDAGNFLASKQENVAAGAYLGVETGTINMPDRNYDIRVSANPGSTVNFTVIAVGAPPPPPPEEYFTDDFNDNLTDTNRWQKIEINGATVNERNQRLEVTVPSGSGWAQAGYVTKDARSVDGFAVEVDIVDNEDVSEMDLMVGLTKVTSSDPYNIADYYRIGKVGKLDWNRLYIQRKRSGVVTTLVDIPWKSRTGKLRIEISGGIISFYENGVFKYAEPYELPSYNCYIYVYQSSDKSQDYGTDAFDDFKLMPFEVLPEPLGIISAIRVQDVSTGKWYNWDRPGPFIPSPVCNPGTNNLYIAVYALNQGGDGNLTLTLKDDTDTTLASKTVYAASGVGFGVEWTGDIPARDYKITLAVTP